MKYYPIQKEKYITDLVIYCELENEIMLDVLVNRIRKISEGTLAAYWDVMDAVVARLRDGEKIDDILNDLEKLNNIQI